MRAVRHQRDHRTAHDEEKNAQRDRRWIEHRVGEPIGFLYTSNNHTQDLHSYNQRLSDPRVLFGTIKDFFSLNRFYSTGATLLWLLDRLDVPDVTQQLKDGKTPAVLLEEHLAPLGDLDELVADALADHDPENRLGATSATLTELALDEPSMPTAHKPHPDPTPSCCLATRRRGADAYHSERVARECLGDDQ